MARRRKKEEPLVVEPGPVRDELMVRLINGVTKAGVEPDQKKVENKRRARRSVDPEAE